MACEDEMKTDLKSEEPSLSSRNNEEALTVEPHEDVKTEGSDPQPTDSLETEDVRSPTPPEHANEAVSEESKSIAPEIPVQSENEVVCNDVQSTAGVEEVVVADQASIANISPNTTSPSSQCSSKYSMIRLHTGPGRRKVAVNALTSASDASSSKSDETSDESDSISCCDIVTSRKQASTSHSECSTQSLTAGKKRKKRVRVYTSDEAEPSECGSSSDSEEHHVYTLRSSRKRRGIKRLKRLDQNTIDARKLEIERRKRIEERQKLYNEVSCSSSVAENGVEVPRFILEMSEDGSEAVVVVADELASCMKAHQRRGVQFLYDNTIESYKKANLEGHGCILAHSMGLGKSLQVVAYLHTVMNSKLLGMKRALIISPLGVVLNWKNEFDLWLFNKGLHLQVFEMSGLKSTSDRIILLQNWTAYGGVLIIGYDMFRLLTFGSRKGNHANIVFETLLDPGPDIVICDEAHILKNDRTGISKALCQIRTKRRICLTGTPLQNSLMEYYCMVNFVKPNLLGTKKEFSASFAIPIRSGQLSDSTPLDVKVMKQRSHILHKLLSGFVQRVGYDAVEESLVNKHEYVLYVRLSPLQASLYNRYLDVVVENLDLKSLRVRNSLFQDFQCLQRVWSHPVALLLHDSENARKAYRSGSDSEAENPPTLAKEITRSSVDQEDSTIIRLDDCNDSTFDNVLATAQCSAEEPTASCSPCPNDLDEQVPEKLVAVRPTWFNELLVESDCSKLELSGKLVLLLKILEKCAEIGDKLLVFSQSLVTLTLIEQFLAAASKQSEANGEAARDCGLLPTGRWVKGYDYLRLDGSTSLELRKQISQRFNDESNLRCRLLLISIRAGSLGINLVGSNRVVIFDANWNPTHEMQAMFRVIRLGQRKPVYVYRFIAQETMESKIYGRQVIKQALAYRVVDEWQIERHFSGTDLVDLYNKVSMEETYKSQPMLHSLPKDRLLADILSECGSWVAKYHEHDSLLKNIVEETLTDEERRAAWAEYQQEKKRMEAEKRASIMTASSLQSSADYVMVDQDADTNTFVDNRVPESEQESMELRELEIAAMSADDPIDLTRMVDSSSSTARDNGGFAQMQSPYSFDANTQPNLRRMLNGNPWRTENSRRFLRAHEREGVAMANRNRYIRMPPPVGSPYENNDLAKDLLDRVLSNQEVCRFFDAFQAANGVSGLEYLLQYIHENPGRPINAVDVPHIVMAAHLRQLPQRHLFAQTPMHAQPPQYFNGFLGHVPTPSFYTR